MKSIFLIPLLYVMSCSSENRQSMKDAQYPEEPNVILLNLVYYDALSFGFQHPLICGVNSNYPHGKELIFRAQESGEVIHAVFPKSLSSPKKLDGLFELLGSYQPYQKSREDELNKVVSEDYQYFLVQSWNQK